MRNLYFFPLLGVLVIALVMILMAECWAVTPGGSADSIGRSPVGQDVIYAHQQTFATGTTGATGPGSVSPRF